MAALGSTIDDVRVVQFAQNVFHLSQQKTSRLFPYMKIKRFKGKSLFMDRMGTTEMIEKTARNQRVIEQDAPWSRRRLTVRPYTWSKYVDTYDKLQNIHNPEDEYSKAAMYAGARRIDYSALEATGGTAYAGEEGSTAVPLPQTQKIAASDYSTGGTAVGGLTIDTLIEVREKLWAAEAIMDEGMVLPFVTRAKEIANLLRTTKVQSADYNTVKALVNGEVSTFMGFRFIRLEFLPQIGIGNTASYANVKNPGGGTATGFQATNRKNYVFVPEAVCLGLNEKTGATVDRIPEATNSILVQTGLVTGGTRLEEVKVIEIVTTN